MRELLATLEAFMARKLEPGFFRFRGRTYKYKVQWNTWKGERVAELPLAAELLRGGKRRALEVGNVLDHHGMRPGWMSVLDRYERAPGVLNRCVLDHCPAEPYDTIISISTLEHVGWDEPEEDLSKAGRAFEHLKGLLAPGGRMLVTAPLGYHPCFPAPLTGWTVLKRSPGNIWRETPPAELPSRPRYGYPEPFCNYLGVYLK